MVAGYLREKKGYYYAVLIYTDSNGNRKENWIATGCSIIGSRRRAEAKLVELCQSFIPEAEVSPMSQMLFSDYMLHWLELIEPTVAQTTYAGYSQIVRTKVAPYFKAKGIKLIDLTPSDLQLYYAYELQNVKAQTVISYHSNIHRALKYAVKNGLILSNPAERVDRPKATRYVGNFYSAEEIIQLLEISQGTKLEFPILLAAFYGLRRSEAIGLKWSAIDFQNNTLTIQHTVTSCTVDGKLTVIHQDTTKTKSSKRTLPLVGFVKERLLELQKKQELNQKLCGNCYVTEYTDYICVDDIGNLITPQYVTETFPKLLKAHGMRRIRYHDLRHSCASLLLSSGVPMKMIQDWLGHSDFATTANIYSHLDYTAKLKSADAMLSTLGIVHQSK